jgi:GTP cyclohydrolase IB
MSVTAPTKKAEVLDIEDVQSRADTRQIPINREGMKDIYHPVRVKVRSSGEQHTIVNFNMYVNLPPTSKARTCRASSKSCTTSANSQ